MDWMRAAFEREGAPLNGVYFCPYHPEASLEEFRRDHSDRKPGPGMLLRAAEDLGIDLAQSIMVGDRCTDIAAANAAGLREAFLLRGTEEKPCPGHALEVGSLADVERWLQEHGTPVR
jgi:D-glycero-D-manno-heptose 1,7-bisphosphate phosphatase